MRIPLVSEKPKEFWAGIGLVAAFHHLLLFLWTPMYDLDTNSFIRGGFTWDIYHNPFLNLYIGILSKLWKNAWFFISGQILFFAFASSFLAWTLFPEKKSWRRAVLVLAALEPVSLFYHFSLLAESFYLSFLLLAVSFLIRWGRSGRKKDAFGLGISLGLGFLAKLSGILHLALLGLILLKRGQAVRTKVLAICFALAPFATCYFFVQIGQKWINSGGLYTVEGRVRWDFSSSQYHPEEVEGDLFKQFVNPHILVNGTLVADRELRRELSYLGYKDCVHFYEYGAGGNENIGIQLCDSLFGKVARQIMNAHFWEAERQFVWDNFRYVHTLNYLDYRFTPNLFYYHPQSEWNYLDSLMETHFGLNLAEQAHRIPWIWKSMDFGNAYMPILWWLGWAGILLGVGRGLFRSRDWETWVIGCLLAIPWVFHLVYISYRPRFLAPYLILELALWVVLAERILTYFQGKKQNLN